MADKIKKIPDEIEENIENTQEGAVTDEEVEAVAGGEPQWPKLTVITTNNTQR